MANYNYFEELRHAIIKQMLEDYVRALRIRDYEKAKEIEKESESEWIGMIGYDLNIPYLMRMCKEYVIYR